MSIEIIPSLLVQTEDEFRHNYSHLEESVDMIQLDIADGKFVSNTTWADPKIVQKIVVAEIELHLMVQDPLTELRRWAEVSRVKRVHFHFESVAEKDVENTILEIRDMGYEVGIALKPETPISVLEPFINHIDAVLFLSVNPGKQGQPFLPEVLHKVRELRAKHPHHYIEIDGGVNEETLPSILEAGVDTVCPGSFIFKTGSSPREQVEKTKAIIEKN